MANVQHSTMTTSDLHEPKGADSAAADTVYVFDGAGSGTAQKIAAEQIDTSSIKNSNLTPLEFNIDEINNAKSHFVVIPYACDIVKIWTALDQAIAGSDVVLTAKIATVAITNGVITITQSGSAAGDVDSATPTGANTVTAGQAIEIACNGGTSTVDAHAHCTIELDIS